MFILLAWGGLGATLGPILMISVFWKKATKWGVTAGLIASWIMVVLWYNTPSLKSSFHEFYPGALVGIIATVVVSLLTKPPKEAAEEMEAIRMTFE